LFVGGDNVVENDVLDLRSFPMKRMTLAIKMLRVARFGALLRVQLLAFPTFRCLSLHLPSLRFMSVSPLRPCHSGISDMLEVLHRWDGRPCSDGIPSFLGRVNDIVTNIVRRFGK
jgi:hypothetical protein